MYTKLTSFASLTLYGNVSSLFESSITESDPEYAFSATERMEKKTFFTFTCFSDIRDDISY